ncbi:MAG: hypothetical protein VCB82_01765, partial [Alphaproteobacteria bacterium]
MATVAIISALRFLRNTVVHRTLVPPRIPPVGCDLTIQLRMYQRHSISSQILPCWKIEEHCFGDLVGHAGSVILGGNWGK